MTTKTAPVRTAVEFSVIGVPKPKGSLRAVARGVLKEELNDGLITWGEAVAAAVRAHRPLRPMAGPVRVGVVFYLPRPKKPKHVWPVTYRRNDIDKLCRTILDHLVDARVLEDDSQVVALEARKVYGEPGANVSVREIG